MAIGLYQTVFAGEISENIGNVRQWFGLSITIFDNEIEEIHNLFFNFLLGLRLQLVAGVLEVGSVSPKFSKVLFFLFVFGDQELIPFCIILYRLHDSDSIKIREWEFPDDLSVRLDVLYLAV